VGSGVCCSVWEAIHQIDEIEIGIVFRRSHRDGSVGLVIFGTTSQDVTWKRRDERVILLGAKASLFLLHPTTSTTGSVAWNYYYFYGAGGGGVIDMKTPLYQTATPTSNLSPHSFLAPHPIPPTYNPSIAEGRKST